MPKGEAVPRKLRLLAWFRQKHDKAYAQQGLHVQIVPLEKKRYTPFAFEVADFVSMTVTRGVADVTPKHIVFKEWTTYPIKLDTLRATRKDPFVIYDNE